MNLTLAVSKVTEQRALITAIRDGLEQSVITVTDGTFQCDPISLERMRSTRDNWIHITHMKDELGRMQWIRADNTIAVFTLPEFTVFVEEVEAAVTARSDSLFATAFTIKSTLPLPDDSPYFDPVNWVY